MEADLRLQVWDSQSFTLKGCSGSRCLESKDKTLMGSGKGSRMGPSVGEDGARSPGAHPGTPACSPAPWRLAASTLCCSLPAALLSRAAASLLLAQINEGYSSMVPYLLMAQTETRGAVLYLIPVLCPAAASWERWCTWVGAPCFQG